MIQAIHRQHAHAAASRAFDRTGWTPEEWVADAERLINELDGSVLDLVNGHVLAMLAEIKRLRELEQRVNTGWLPFGWHGCYDTVPTLEFSDTERDEDGDPLWERDLAWTSP